MTRGPRTRRRPRRRRSSSSRQATRRDIAERAASIGAVVEVVAGGGEVRLVVPLPRAPESGRAGVMQQHGAGEPGPGILETSLVLGLAVVLAVAMLVFFGGQLADIMGVLVDAAHGR